MGSCPLTHASIEHEFMIDNIHIIAYGDDLLSRVAYAMQEKGLSVSCSGCAPELTAKLHVLSSA